MFGEKSIELIKEIKRTTDVLSAYNDDLVQEVSKEINSLVKENHDDAQNFEMDDNVSFTSIRIRHIIIQHNVRCLLAYHYNRLLRLRDMRWQFGSVFPPEIKSNLSTSERDWLSKYSLHLSKYMKSIGPEGYNLSVDLKPPKSLFIQVHCLVDYGKYQLNDGSIISLEKNTIHFLPRSDCEQLIQLKIVEHVQN